MRSCQLRSATLKYPIQIQGNNLTFTESLDDLTKVSIQSPALSCGSMANGGRLSVGWTEAGFGLQLFNSKACWQGKIRFEDFMITANSKYVSELNAEQ